MGSLSHCFLGVALVLATGGMMYARAARDTAQHPPPVLAIGSCTAPPAEPQPTTGQFVVNTLNDSPDAVVGDGRCDNGSNECSLRAAIMESNASPNTFGRIKLQAGRYTLSAALVSDDGNSRGEDAARAGDLDITAAVLIEGSANGTVVIDAASIDRVFDIHSTSVELRDLTITGGDTRDENERGGGILVRPGAALVISDSIVRGNDARVGGGVSVSGGASFNATNVVIDGNEARDGGGGMFNAGATWLTSVVISENTAPSSRGGGIFNGSGRDESGAGSLGEILVSASEVSANMAESGGGIFVGDGSLVLCNSTVSSNTAAAGSGINFLRSTTVGSAQVTHTTIANNVGGDSVDSGAEWQLRSSIIWSPSSNACGGVDPQSSGLNVISDSSCGSSSAGDIVVSEPRIGSLQNHGHLTSSHELLSDSPAIDSGDCADIFGKDVAVDQRGLSRPQGNQCDIGAFEFQVVDPTETSSDATATERETPIFEASPQTTPTLTVTPQATATPPEQDDDDGTWWNDQLTVAAIGLIGVIAAAAIGAYATIYAAKQRGSDDRKPSD